MQLGMIGLVWRRGAVISSWLLDVLAAALAADPELRGFCGRVADSGCGPTVRPGVRPSPLVTPRRCCAGTACWSNATGWDACSQDGCGGVPPAAAPAQ